MKCLPRILSSSEYNFFHPAYWFGDTDARPLGLFRIAFAGLMLKEAIYHIFVAEIWYSDTGMFPARLLPHVAPNTSTLMSSLNDTWMATAFFVVWGVVALALLLGWHTRVMSVLNFVLLASVINRNPLVVTGADSVMQVLAFWSLFIPMGRCYSFDSRRRDAKSRQTTYAFPVRMMQIQVALIYIFTTIYKLEGQTWRNGDALYMAMQVRMHTFPLADWLLVNAPTSILHFLTYTALLIEAAFAFLVFVPLFQPYLRRFGLILGACLHVGIGFVMNIPNFPLVMIFSYLLFLDSGWVNRIENIFRNTETSSQPANIAPPIHTQAARSGCLGMLVEMQRGMVFGAYRGLLACTMLVIMIFVIWSNVLNDEHLAIRLNTPAMPGVVEEKMRTVGLWEAWPMFAPDPLSYEGWFGLNGIFKNGDTYDLRSGIDRPHWYLGPLARWGKLEENLMSKDKDDPLFVAWAGYTCQQYRSTGVVGVQIVLYSRPTSPPGQAFLPYHVNVIRGADCR